MSLMLWDPLWIIQWCSLSRYQTLWTGSDSSTRKPNIVRDHPPSSHQYQSPDFILVYYSLYTEEGVIEPKISFKTYSDGSPSIARINRNLIPPQYDRDAVIRCIAYVEGFSPCIWHQLFASVVSKSPIDALNIWDMQPGCPGSLPERPLVFVKSAYLTKRGILRNCPTECS